MRNVARRSKPGIIAAVVAMSIAMSGCATTADPDAPHAENNPDFAMLWVQHAAEYRAVSLQAYAEAGRDLPGLLEDTSWSALPGVPGDASKPPAIILDMDETVVSNWDFQINHLPYTSYKHYVWNRDNKALPVPGAVEFIREAQAAGVEVFYVTNRPCEAIEGEPGTCPQKQVSYNDLLEAGFSTDLDHLQLAWERPHWGKEKLSRRLDIAQTHRVIMLFGDDLSDFVVCARENPVAPCNTAATKSSREADVLGHAAYWGQGWYILPNPMHGSWTSFP